MEMQVANEEVLSQVIQGIKSLRKANKVTLESFYFDTGIHIARIEQGLRGHRSIVQKAVAAHEISARMMPGRACGAEGGP